MSEDLQDLIAGMLNPDPEERLTLTQIKSHPWLRIQANQSFGMRLFSSQDDFQETLPSTLEENTVTVPELSTSTIQENDQMDNEVP